VTVRIPRQAANYDPAESARLDRSVAVLETALQGAPDNRQVAAKLVQLLDYHVPPGPATGPVTALQSELAAFPHDARVPDRGSAVSAVTEWLGRLQEMPVATAFAQLQLFDGQDHRIQGETAYCGQLLKLFDTQGVIGRICHDCYKVQILPADLVALIQVYFILRTLDLPRDNSRKTMVEIRPDVASPYKGYIYCQSEDEVRRCHQAFIAALEAWRVEGVAVAISHGCSEYGLAHPDWKFSENGRHRDFPREPHWDAAEAAFFAENPTPPAGTSTRRHRFVTVRDILVFRTWVDYAQIIGDPGWRAFRSGPADAIPEPFATRVRRQAEQRSRERADLMTRLGI